MDKSKCYVRGWFYLPSNNCILTPELLSSLVYTSPYLDVEKTIPMFCRTENHVGLPIEWVKQHYPELYNSAIDERANNPFMQYEKLPQHNHPSVKNPKEQERVYNDILSTLQRENNALICLPTGFGKTMLALKAAAVLGQRTLVLVNTNELKLQWIQRIFDALGITEDKIGVAQSDKCQYEGKYITIGLLQSMARREYSDDFYNAFGTVIVDEGHNISTEFFGNVLPMFNAKYRMVLSATPTRKDRSDVVIYNHVGDVRVSTEDTAVPCKVYVVKYKNPKLWGDSDRSRITAISRDYKRNQLLIKYIVDFYKAGREVLAVSNSVKHIETLIPMAIKAGIPAEAIGQYTASKTVDGKTKKTKPDELKEHLHNRQIVFATYGLVKEATDKPKWDAGIELVPSYKGTQVIGRIRRPQPKKKYPIWISILDNEDKFDFSERYLNKMYRSRRIEWINSGATVTP